TSESLNSFPTRRSSDLGQGHGVGFTELHPREPGATGPPHRQHLVAQIDAHDATGGADGPRHLLGEEAGAGADVDHLLARLELERSEEHTSELQSRSDLV